jgi:hypothetical protein
MKKQKKKEKSKFLTIFIPLVFIAVLSVVLFIAIDETMVGQDSYRASIWDKIRGRDVQLPEGRAQYSQQVLIQVCKNVAIDSFGRDLIQSDFDKRASRYNAETKVHTIFMDLRIKNRGNVDIYIRCDISAVNRQVLESRIKNATGFSFF